jgi:hypothetical protein
MEWGDKIDFYSKLESLGRLRPTDVQPEIGPFVFYWDSFIELGSCRSLGMSVGPIPFSVIREYATIYDVEDFEEFLWIIRKMDSTYLAEVNKSNGKTSKGNSSPSGHQGKPRSKNNK